MTSNVTPEKRKRKRQACLLNLGKESEGLSRPFVFSLHKNTVVTMTRQLGENKKPQNKSKQNKNCVGVYALLQLWGLVYLLIIVPIQCRLFKSCIESVYFPLSLFSWLLCFAKHFPSCEKSFLMCHPSNSNCLKFNSWIPWLFKPQWVCSSKCSITI